MQEGMYKIRNPYKSIKTGCHFPIIYDILIFVIREVAYAK